MKTSRRIFSLWVMLASLAGAATFKVDDPVDVLWGATWHKARIMAVEPTRWRISYEGFGSNWDEWVSADRIRVRGTVETKPVAGAAVTAAPEPTFAFPAQPAGKKAGLEGAYLRVVSWYFNGNYSLTNEGWFFTKEGRFSKSPVGGFDFKAFAETKTARKSDGVYWIEGGKIFLAWADGTKRSDYSFAVKKDALEIGGIAATRVEGFTRGWRADAHYEGGATARGAGSFISSAQSLRLRRDGTFGFDAIGGVNATTATTSVSGSSSSETKGTYEFDGHTLTLKHTDGRLEKRTIFAFSDRNAQGAPAYLWRDGSMMHRRDAKK
jgi:hypothetical protein